MFRKGARQSRTDRGFVIHLNFFGTLVIGIALVAAVVLVTCVYLASRSKPAATGATLTTNAPAAGERPGQARRETPPWGEIETTDMELEQPEEYIAYQMNTNVPPQWVFTGMTTNEARALMVKNGFDERQLQQALAPESLLVTASNVVIRPEDALVLGLSRQTRGAFYGELGRLAGNYHMTFPFDIPAGTFDERFAEGPLDGAELARLKSLLYPRGSAECFSDLELMLRSLSSDAQRLELIKTLSLQSAVLANLRIRPDTDIDKILGYWGRGLQVKDVRPLLDSLKRLPGGGVISLLHLLPPFARERLYTFPEPARPGDPALDCHWSTMNFFNATPDDRFADPDYTTRHILANYYPVARPGLYGDLVLLIDEHEHAIHSGVYLADDLVFTKNGNNDAQPWKLMHMKDMLSAYDTVLDSTMRMAFYREKTH